MFLAGVIMNEIDPLSMLAQLTRQIRPSKLELAKAREQEWSRKKRNTPEYRKKEYERRKNAKLNKSSTAGAGVP